MSFKGLLNATCTIQALTTTINNLGAYTSSFSAGVVKNCRINALTVGGESEIASRWADREVFKMFLDETANIGATHRVISGGSTFNVLQSDSFDKSSNRHHIEAIIEMVR